MYAISIGTGRPEAAPATRVALYACIADGRDPDDVMGTLRAHARAKGWSVTAALYDLGPLDRPKSERSALTRVTRLLEGGEADGIVILDETHLATTPLARAKLRSWLDGLGDAAFVEAVSS
ncbi:hypothetical protein [Streptomyces sp. CBMA152]|uniref:hypothetical protein n=1 Tax=Streptomyces sp. CBMA152 TaxID=1896312 RepID=UPI0016612137|nr:hypothetical protein [Streptomyces sp. CBMA152]MBD0742782.1 hypothetical protein [Streptomyces sp. CBMA152]